jgi:hypothetical protein
MTTINATQTASVQVRNAITTIKSLGPDLRNWSASARKELRLGGNVDVLNGMGNVIGTAPKLALVVASPVFRAHFEAHPEAPRVKVTDPNFEDCAVKALVQWVTSITNHSTGKFAVELPQNDMDVLKVRYVAFKLGMEYIVIHFGRNYKGNHRHRTPSSGECALVERLFLGEGNEVLMAVGERMAYMRRRRQFNADQLAAVTKFFNENEHVGNAVNAADARAYNSRK